MERNNYQQMNTRKLVKIIAATDLFAVIGAVFGVTFTICIGLADFPYRDIHTWKR